MSDFLTSLKADLLDRQLLPLLALLGVALVGALAYAAASGGGSSGAPAPTPGAPSSRPTLPGIALSTTTANPSAPVAETVSGVPYQRGGPIRDPFTPLPQPVVATVASTSSSSSSTGGPSASTSSTPSATTSSSSTSSSSSTPTPATKPSQLAKPKTVYVVSVLFGVAAPGTPTQLAQLTPYPHLALQQPLPDAKSPLVAFGGVTAGGKRAIFTLVGEVFPHGQATCLPSATQCKDIELSEDQSEELEYVSASGAPTVYRLVLEHIASKSASAASTHPAPAR